MVPLALVSGVVILVSIWAAFLLNLSILIVLVLVPIVFAMRMIAKQDDQQFRLLWLKFLFQKSQPNRRFWKAAAYSPLKFENRCQSVFRGPK